MGKRGGSAPEAAPKAPAPVTPAAAVPPAAAADEGARAEEGDRVAALLTKRLRAVRKKLSNIERIQAQVAGGRPINAEQESALTKKEALEGAAEELEKLLDALPPLVAEERAAVAEEAQARAADATQAAIAEALARVPPPPPPGPSAAEVERLVEKRLRAGVERLLALQYFAALFADESNYATQMERSAALSWDAYEAKARVRLRLAAPRQATTCVWLSAPYMSPLPRSLTR